MWCKTYRCAIENIGLLLTKWVTILLNRNLHLLFYSPWSTTPKFFFTCGWRVADCVVTGTVLSGEGRVRSAWVRSHIRIVYMCILYTYAIHIHKVYELLELNKTSKTITICLSMRVTNIPELLFLAFQFFLLTACGMSPCSFCHKSPFLVPHVLGREEEYYDLTFSSWVLSFNSVITCQNPSACTNVDVTNMTRAALDWETLSSV